MMMGPTRMVRYGATSSIGLAAFVSRPHGAITGAQTDAPAGYAGDLWSRPRLSPATGGESRDWLAKPGVTLDHRFAQVLQGAATGRARHGCGAYNVGLSINGLDPRVPQDALGDQRGPRSPVRQRGRFRSCIGSISASSVEDAVARCTTTRRSPAVAERWPSITDRGRGLEHLNASDETSPLPNARAR